LLNKTAVETSRIECNALSACCHNRYLPGPGWLNEIGSWIT